MIKFGLVGYGKWGKILFKTISSIGKVVFVSNTKKTYKNKNNIDFCLVASTDSSHYRIVKYFLKKKIPVFCEKPLTRNLNQSKELISLSKKLKTKLYVNHIELFKKKKIKIYKSNLIVRGKNSIDNIKNILWKLCYHDLYLLYGNLKDKKLRIKPILLSKKELKFSIYDGKREYLFNYDYQSEKKIHSINNISFITKINHLKSMILGFIKNKINLDLNHKQALFCIKTINDINKKIF